MHTLAMQEHDHVELLATPINHHSLTQVVYGPGCVDKLGELVARRSAKQALIVTDPHIRSAGHLQHAVTALDNSHVGHVVFDSVHENPTTLDVSRCVEVARSANVDIIIGLGGGSSMDCAKGCNFILTNGGRMQDYWGVGKATQPMLPMVAIPTTAGTGSEAQSFALISDAETHVKMACGDKKAACEIAILDPELTTTMPRQVTAVTGIDAISHAIETSVTLKKTVFSQMYASEAWRLLNAHFEHVMRESDNINARGAMLLGANFAGTAIENSMLGAAHACANPLTTHYNVIHGRAIGIMLPHVIRFNGASVGSSYIHLAALAGYSTNNTTNATEWLANRVEQLVTAGEQPIRLRDCGVLAELIPLLAQEATKQWTGSFNPRKATLEDFEQLYRSAL